MSLAKIIKAQRPQRKGAGNLLIELAKHPKLKRWLERQATIHSCSKTVYVLALIEQDLRAGGE